MNKKLVSVIIPTYGGGGDGLDKTIESILSQTYNHIEIIVVDDNGYGSANQKSTELVLHNNNFYEKVKYITPLQNGGGSVARNIGAKASRGEYLMFLDDDDTVSNDKIEKQVQALENGNGDYGLAYCSAKIYCGERYSNIIKASQSGDILEKYLLGKIYIGTGTALILREAWESLGGYDESFSRHQDWEFFARVLNRYKAIAVPDAYFNRYILGRYSPKELDAAERNMDHYLKFLKTYTWRLPKKTINRVVNLKNASIAIICLRKRQFKHFIAVMKKYDKPLLAYSAFIRFVFMVVLDKMKGKKS